jgi:hypothetical protein
MTDEASKIRVSFCADPSNYRQRLLDYHSSRH